MDHLAGNTGNLCQGGKGRLVGREDISMDSCSGEECSLRVWVCLYANEWTCLGALMFRTR